MWYEAVVTLYHAELGTGINEDVLPEFLTVLYRRNERGYCRFLQYISGTR